MYDDMHDFEYTETEIDDSDMSGSYDPFGLDR